MKGLVRGVELVLGSPATDACSPVLRVWVTATGGADLPSTTTSADFDGSVAFDSGFAALAPSDTGSGAAPAAVDLAA